MTEDQIPANVDAGKNATDEISEGDYIAQLVSQNEVSDEPIEEAEAEEEAEVTDEPIESDEESDEPEEPGEDIEEDDEVEPEVEAFDLENLTEDQIEVIRKTLKSKAAARIGKLTGELKATKERLDALERQAGQQQDAPDPVESRFLEGISSPEDLAQKVVDLRKLAKDTDILLDDNEHLGPDDEIEVGDKYFTKAQLKTLKRQVREALDEAVPYKQHQFAQEQQRKALKQQFDTVMAKEVSELKDEESEVSKNFKILNESELFKQIREKVPDAGPSLDYVIAHFCRSKFGKPTAAKAQKAAGRIKPPSSLTSSAAAPGQPRATGKNKAAQDGMKRFEKSGSQEDLVNALAANLTT